MTNILTPIETPYPSDAAKILERYPQQDGYVLQVFRVFANSLRFLTKGMPNLLDKESPLSLRAREIVILRVTANRNCQYEWGVHVSIFAKHAKLTEKQIADTRREIPQSDDWSAAERILITAIDQLCTSGRMDGPTLAQFRTEYTKEDQLEICALAGAYHTVSFVANMAQMEDEPFGAKFPG